LWNQFAVSPPLPRDFSPQMGIAMKYLSDVKSRFWEKDKLAPDAFSDESIAMTWDGTDGQEGEGHAALIGFTGGPSCAKFIEERASTGPKQMEAFYPGFKENLVSDRVMHWPGDPLTKAGYSFPAPGQVMRAGPILYNGLGKLHFAGEHCSYQFCGYMEGALYSGATLAKRLAVRDGVLRA
jgi:monoamine oxidase